MIKFCDWRATIIITIGVVCNFSMLIVNSSQTFAISLNSTLIASDDGSIHIGDKYNSSKIVDLTEADTADTPLDDRSIHLGNKHNSGTPKTPLYVLSQKIDLTKAGNLSNNLEDELQNSLILIEFETSRSRITIGSVIYLVAKITNISTVPVILTEDDLILTLPREISSYHYPAVFSTENENANNPANGNKCIEIKSKESYRAVWQLVDNSTTEEANWLKNTIAWWNSNFFGYLKYTFFEPGNYNAIVNVRYWTTKENDQNKCNKTYKFNSEDFSSSKLYTKEQPMLIDSPQQVIILGAIIGGFVSWLLTLLLKINTDITNNEKDYLLVFFKKFPSCLGSMLLSGIVTILLSRMSDGTFIINVTVNDFWGAIATGFVASYFGTPLLDQFKPKGLGGEKSAEDKPDLGRENGNNETTVLGQENVNNEKLGLVQENGNNETTALDQENVNNEKPDLGQENSNNETTYSVNENGNNETTALGQENSNNKI
ncbi:hypothetical protein [Nodularia spumigena]|uniref:Uncharacterized protein n=1 Tax=Nodularia spumigena UHCC 0060 TaxID=3110300 RepID=A0ABU5UQR2_NODSP|nr:hypothetical protein [Nodularia spumigena]MEA5526664.1 hypothetical protein [Nodularia spumigena UHCC 0143]MEA5608139.1 hypothetical protein [Nodularia spumigena UHCC 0060]MEA5612739.1 hypothetical protein [Nodularia spumigena UHCC 0040]